jgi:hypothetical protein
VKTALLKTTKKKHSAKKLKMKALYTISVKVDQNRISLSARDKKIDKRAGDEVVWNCTGGTMSITWPGTNGCPFDPAKFNNGAQSSIASGKILKGKGTYKYTLTIFPSTLPKDSFSIDPQIEVDDSGLVLANVTD